MKDFTGYASCTLCDQGLEPSIKQTSYVPKMLEKANVKNVRHKTSYCCISDMKVIAEFEGPDKETVRNALTNMSMPFAAIMEAIKV